MDYFKGKTLDKEISLPLHFQIKEVLLDYISYLSEGDPIPTEMELCGIFKVSRPTVRQAVNELVLNGLIVRRKGKGSFVAQRKIKQDFLIVLESFNDEMQSKGLVPETRLLSGSVRKSTRLVSRSLKLPRGEEIISLIRLRSINSEPIVLVNSYLPASMLPGLLQKNLEQESLYKIIERDYGYSVSYTRRMIEARLASDFEVEALRIKPMSAVHQIQTVAYTEDNIPVEFSTAVYRGDRNRFSIEVRKKKL
jgi:GntR family transcriptional regulator